MKHYFDITELAERLHIKPSALYAWVEQGKIPHLKLGRLVRFDPHEIDVWLHDHRREGSKPQPPRRRRVRQETKHVDELIVGVKRDVYTPRCGKPDQDRATRKGENDGSV